MPQVGEHVVLSWAELASFVEADGRTHTIRNEVKHYEVRRGANWTFGKGVVCTPCTSVRTRDWCVGTETYFVRAMLNSGHYTRPASVSVACTTPARHSDEDDRDETTEGGGWAGTTSDTEADGDDYLILSAGAATGTYTSPEIDLGSLQDWRVGIMLHAECYNTSTQWDGVAWSDLTGLTWDDMQSTYGQWNYRDWESQLVQEMDWNGNNIYSPTASWTLESTVYSATGTPGTLQTHTPGVKYGRYLQFKITLNRTSLTDESIRVTKCLTTWSKPAQGDVRAADDNTFTGDNIFDTETAFRGDVVIDATDPPNSGRGGADPGLRLYADSGDSTDYIDIYHDDSLGGVFKVGTGRIVFDFIDSFRCRKAGADLFNVGGSQTYDETTWGVYDAFGNNLIITNSANWYRNHDHGLQTNPTLYVHSDTNPDSANDEWISLTHDQTDGVIDVGSGVLKADCDLTVTGTLNWSAEPATAKVYTESHSGSIDGERWFEFVSSVMYSCIHWDGTDYSVALS